MRRLCGLLWREFIEPGMRIFVWNSVWFRIQAIINTILCACYEGSIVNFCKKYHFLLRSQASLTFYLEVKCVRAFCVGVVYVLMWTSFLIQELSQLCLKIVYVGVMHFLLETFLTTVCNSGIHLAMSCWSLKMCVFDYEVLWLHIFSGVQWTEPYNSSHGPWLCFLVNFCKWAPFLMQ